MTFSRNFALLLVPLTLAACGGTTTPAPTPTPVPVPVPNRTFSELENSADDLENKYATVAFSDEAQIPLAGSATYDGPFLLDFGSAFDSDENEAAGEGDLAFNFNRGDALSGTITDLVREDGTDITGSISLSNSSIDRSSGTFSTSSSQGSVEANMSGILRNQEGDTITLSGELEGDFKGPSRQGFIGETAGTINVNGSRYSWDGAFYTEQ